MYLEYYGFRENPFNLTPDPRFVFLSKTHREAFAHLLYGIQNRVGFIALTGEVGSGKTTVLRTFLSYLDSENYRTALIFNPLQSPSDFLQSINRELGIPPSTSPGETPLDALNQFLLRENAAGRTVVLVIDESQNLSASTLEQVRLVSNLETDRAKLIQIILAGQPELGQMLKRKELRQLSQRIIVAYHLQPMDFQDTVQYIKHRIGVAGARGGVLFSKWALKRIYRHSRGLPRLINTACDRALLVGFTLDSSKITHRHAGEAIRDLKKDPLIGSPKRRLILIPLLALLVVLLAAGLYFAGLRAPAPFFDLTRLWGRGGLSEETPGPTREDITRAMAAELGNAPEPAGIQEEFSVALEAELGNLSEDESARRAFNVLAGLWNVNPLPELISGNAAEGMERAARGRGLQLYRFSGNLGALLRMDYPAALELVLPGVEGKRFLSIVGMSGEQVRVEPPLAGWRALPSRTLEKYWSGHGFLLWKDPLNLQAKVSMGSRGEPVKRLQDLLREAGVYQQPLTGIYGSETLSAVKEFQASKGMEKHGLVDPQTLMLLYRAVNRFEVPGLTAGNP
ncbi:MAG: AAA family ATPase [Syntrophaceae bacterium]|nr:AAA family ATPase [Syntrophaceae bacterium]